jgi:hypothetical protein
VSELRSEFNDTKNLSDRTIRNYQHAVRASHAAFFATISVRALNRLLNQLAWFNRRFSRFLRLLLEEARQIKLDSSALFSTLGAQSLNSVYLSIFVNESKIYNLHKNSKMALGAKSGQNFDNKKKKLLRGDRYS